MSRLRISYDEAEDILTIEGIRYSGSLLRSLGNELPGSWLRILGRKDGVITCFRTTPAMERSFDVLVGLTQNESPK